MVTQVWWLKGQSRMPCWYNMVTITVTILPKELGSQIISWIIPSSLPRILPIGALLPFGLISESYFKVTDTDSSCSVWAKAGWCQAITDLLDKCPHSCQKYGVQGANSLEERYITVNFRDSSSAPTFSEIVAPPPPPGGISPQSDINLVCGRIA